MRSAILTVSLVVAGGFATAQAPKPSVLRFSNPPGLARPTGYTHVVEALGGRTIYIAGQVALDRDGNVVGQGDFRAQTKRVFENLKTALNAAGATFSDVAKINVYVTDMSQVQALREIRGEYIKDNPPASTLVQVARLAREEFLLEIEAIAVTVAGVAVTPAWP